ncbi:hypothetical protein AeRB84_015200 [Aphanomyces euteiches]|nr:hypothetical protein AeRB84_015200 [Aphanomyces euteiches]
MDWLAQRSLAEWHEEAIHLLDLRELSEQTYTFESPLVVNIPWSEQKNRSNEYPSRATKFALLCPEDKAGEQVEWFMNADLHPTKQPWLVQFFVVDSDQTRETAERLSLLASSMVPSIYPYPRLWAPNSLMIPLLSMLKASTPFPAGSVVYDLGCGSGRDIMFLAEEMRGSNVSFCGVDYNKTGARNTPSFAERRGVADTYTYKLLDLRKQDLVRAMLEQSNHSIVCVYGCRYLNRDLLDVVQSALPVGSLLAWSHFSYPTDGEWRWQHPSKPSDILQHDELLERFGSNGFEIILNAYETDSDHGRPLNQFIARKLITIYEITMNTNERASGPFPEIAPIPRSPRTTHYWVGWTRREDICFFLFDRHLRWTSTTAKTARTTHAAASAIMTVISGEDFELGVVVGATTSSLEAKRFNAGEAVGLGCTVVGAAVVGISVGSNVVVVGSGVGAGVLGLVVVGLSVVVGSTVVVVVTGAAVTVVVGEGVVVGSNVVVGNTVVVGGRVVVAAVGVAVVGVTTG